MWRRRSGAGKSSLGGERSRYKNLTSVGPVLQGRAACSGN